LVFSDKSETLEAFRFSVDGAELSGGERVLPSEGPGVAQLEAATVTEDGRGVLVVTSGSFNGAPGIDQNREDRALLMEPDGSGAWTVARDLTEEWRRFLQGHRRETGGWLKVEGLATLGKHYLVGIRQFGDAFDRFDYGIRLAVWDPEKPSDTTTLADPRSLTFEERGDITGGDRVYMRNYGVSSIECEEREAAGGPRCYMLVSSEAGPGVHDVKSRLLAVDPGKLAGSTSLPGTEIACFWGKAEGLTLLGGGQALVIFDSDLARKGGAGSSDLFPLGANQDYYWIGPVDGSSTGACVGP